MKATNRSGEKAELGAEQNSTIQQLSADLESIETAIARLSERLASLPDGLERTTSLTPEQAATVDAARGFVRWQDHSKIRQGFFKGQFIPHACIRLPNPANWLHVLKKIALVKCEPINSDLSSVTLKDGWRVLLGRTNTDFELIDAAHAPRAHFSYSWREDGSEDVFAMTTMRARYVILEQPVRRSDGSVLHRGRFVAVDRKTDQIVIIGDTLPKPLDSKRWQDGDDVIVGQKSFQAVVALRRQQIENALERLVKNWQSGFDDAAWDAPGLPPASETNIQSLGSSALPSPTPKRKKGTSKEAK